MNANHLSVHCSSLCFSLWSRSAGAPCPCRQMAWPLVLERLLHVSPSQRVAAQANGCQVWFYSHRMLTRARPHRLGGFALFVRIPSSIYVCERIGARRHLNASPLKLADAAAVLARDECERLAQVSLVGGKQRDQNSGIHK